MRNAIAFVTLLIILFTSTAFAGNISIIATPFYLVGGTANGKWIEAESLAKNIKGGEKYQLFSLGKLLGKGTGKKTEWIEGPGRYPHISIDNKLFSDSVIAISCDWNPIPRKIEILSNDNATYKKVVSDILRKEGLTIEDPEIKQIIKTDLDNNGQDEVIITASNLSFPLKTKMEENTYSIVIARKINGSKVKNYILEKFIGNMDMSDIEEVKPSRKGPNVDPTPYAYDVPFILDANGDGKMEIFIQTKYYEGESMNVFQLIGKNFKRVLNYGVGA